MQIVHVAWPSGETQRIALEQQRVPRLLLVDPCATPPTVTDPIEDWVRLPATPLDISARSAQLSIRLGRVGTPRIDDDGVLRVGARWSPLAPVEIALTKRLLAKFGAVVSRDHLAQAAWPGGCVERNALDVRILRLRRRIEPLDLVIRTVRSRGYAIDYA